MSKLLLNRKPGQSIMIGDDIEITFIEHIQGQAKICINAPRDIPVFRRELYDERKGGVIKNKEESSGNL